VSRVFDNEGDGCCVALEEEISIEIPDHGPLDVDWRLDVVRREGAVGILGGPICKLGHDI
jgi:hypothetical protein